MHFRLSQRDWSVGQLRLRDSIAFNNTGGTPMQLIQVLGQPYYRSPIRQRNSRILEVSSRYKVLNTTQAE